MADVAGARAVVGVWNALVARSMKPPGRSNLFRRGNRLARFSSGRQFLHVRRQFIQVRPTRQVKTDHLVSPQRRPATGPKVDEQTGDDRFDR